MSVIVPIRLSESEVANLEAMAEKSEAGVENRSDLIRLWIHREWNKREGIANPSGKDFQSAFRIGRPAKGSVRWKLSRARFSKLKRITKFNAK